MNELMTYIYRCTKGEKGKRKSRIFRVLSGAQIHCNHKPQSQVLWWPSLKETAIRLLHTWPSQHNNSRLLVLKWKITFFLFFKFPCTTCTYFNLKKWEKRRNFIVYQLFILNLCEGLPVNLIKLEKKLSSLSSSGLAHNNHMFFYSYRI